MSRSHGPLMESREMTTEDLFSEYCLERDNLRRSVEEKDDFGQQIYAESLSELFDELMIRLKDHDMLVQNGFSLLLRPNGGFYERRLH